jgi:4a-hydroxytetrahydrobiopterin dehydratase
MSLFEERCQRCGPGTPALPAAEVAALLAKVPDWRLEDQGRSLVRGWAFGSYGAGLAFVNAVAGVAEAEKHHPDIELGYKRARVRFTTHAAGGLTLNDFICAAKLDRLTP